MKNVEYKLRNRIYWNVYNQTEDQIWIFVRRQVGFKIDYQILDLISDEIKEIES
jgi:hypothetical protein